MLLEANLNASNAVEECCDQTETMLSQRFHV